MHEHGQVVFESEEFVQNILKEPMNIQEQDDFEQDEDAILDNYFASDNIIIKCNTS